MKTYNVSIYRFDHHGNAGAQYKGLCNWTIEAKNKKEAREAAFDAMIGKRAADYDFPIDFSHAPEATKKIYPNGHVVYSMDYKGMQSHLINEFDISVKRQFAVDVVEVKE